MQFEFATATRIIFGNGTVEKVISEVTTLGAIPLVISGRKGKETALIQQLKRRSIPPVHLPVSGEPTVSMVTDAVAIARGEHCTSVISIGGGSVIDCGKAVAALCANDGELLDYLEVIGKGRMLKHPTIPFVAIPTTSGTGAEVTRNAVITSEEHQVKVSLRSPFMLPQYAIVDPLLTHSLPRSITASTGLDALTQCIESFVSAKSQPITTALCREGILRAARSLRTACSNVCGAVAREDMALSSLLSGLALANSGLGAIHGLAAPIGGKCTVAHGVVCARLLPHVMEVNVRALQRRVPDSPILDRFREIAAIVTGYSNATVSDGVAWIHALCADLPVPSAADIALDPTHFPEIIQAAQRASSMKGNPVDLTDDELTGVMTAAFGV